jgi:integrase
MKGLPPGIELLPSGSYRATVYVDGRPVRETRPNMDEAVAWRHEQMAAKLNGDSSRHTVARANGKRRTLAAFRAEWVTGRRVVAGTAATQDGYWSNHIEQYLGRIRLCDLTTAKMDVWVNGMIKRGAGAHTVYGAVMHVSAIMTAAGFRGADNPRVGMEPLPPRPRANRRAAATDELAAILANSSGQWAVLWELIACTGLRFSEATGLRVSSIRMEPTPHLWIDAVNERKRSKRRPGGFRPFTKSTKPRPVPLPAFMAAKLAELVAGRSGADYVFTNSDGGLLDYDNVQRREWAATRAAAGSTLNIHELRHTYITRLVASGASTQAVQMVGGWSDGRMVTTYTDIQAGMLANMAAVFEPAPEPPSNVVPLRPRATRGKRRA